MFFDKKWGILIKKESESLIFTGLKIPRDYMIPKEDYDFLCFVFQQRYFRRDFGLYDFVAPEHKELDKQVNYDMNFKRLYELEKKFALDAGLIGEGDIDERTKD